MVQNANKYNIDIIESRGYQIVLDRNEIIESNMNALDISKLPVNAEHFISVFPLIDV